MTLEELRRIAINRQIPNAQSLGWAELMQALNEQNAAGNWAVHAGTDYK